MEIIKLFILSKTKILTPKRPLWLSISNEFVDIDNHQPQLFVWRPASNYKEF